jgi:Tfp pilus assembly protein PilX
MKRIVSESGQALVLVLLSLAVVLTIVLFILSRTVTDVSISSSESQAVSAFSAAEAGVERALVVGSAPGGSVQVGDASYTASVTNVASGVRSFLYPVELNSGDTVTVWLNSQDASPDYNGSSLRVCWGKPGTPAGSSTTPAIEVSVVHGTGSNVRVFRQVADPYQGRTPDNAFPDESGSLTVDGVALPFCTTLSFSGLGTRQFATVRMFYNTNTSQPVGFDSTSASALFPSQGIVVRSTGTSGQSNRKVEAFQSWPEVPNVFQFGVYSPSGITK